jgi:hypothetical protein
MNGSRQHGDADAGKRWKRETPFVRENVSGASGGGVYSDETKSRTGRDTRTGRRRTLVARVLFWVLLAAGVAYLLSPFLYGALFADREPETLRIENRTDETILVYQVWVDGSEHRLERLARPIAPRTSGQTEIFCAAVQLVARTEEGSFVARRGPFEECNLETWVIETLGG